MFRCMSHMQAHHSVHVHAQMLSRHVLSHQLHDALLVLAAHLGLDLLQSQAPAQRAATDEPRQTDRHKDRQTYRHTYKETNAYRHTDKETNRHDFASLIASFL